MTLIAAFEIRNTPVLLGDLLLSSPNFKGSTDIPTIGDTSKLFPPDSTKTIYGLVQKVNIIGKNLVVSWAGDFYVARKIITLLEEEASINPFTKKSLDNFFETYSDLIEDKEIAIIGYLQDNDVINLIKKRGSRLLINTNNIPNFGKISTCGSGCYDIEEVLENFSMSLSAIQTTHEDIFRHIVSQSTALCGWFYSDEMRLLGTSKKSIDDDDFDRTLLSFYGGGYEIAFLTEKGFGKLGDITYFTWKTQKLANNSIDIQLLSRAFYITYVDDLLIIYVIDFDEDSDDFRNSDILKIDGKNYKTFKVSKDTAYIVPPIYRGASEIEMNEVYKQTQDSFMHSEVYSNFIYPIDQNKLVGNPVSIPLYSALEDKSPFIYTSNGSNDLFLAISTEYLEYLSTFHNLSSEV